MKYAINARRGARGAGAKAEILAALGEVYDETVESPDLTLAEGTGRMAALVAVARKLDIIDEYRNLRHRVHKCAASNRHKRCI